MKNGLILAILATSIFTSAEAKSLIGRIEKYIIPSTGQIIEIGTNEISDDGKTGEYFDYRDHKRKEIEMDKLSKLTNEKIAGVQIGDTILVTTTIANSRIETISRYCEVYNLFENKEAYVGCKSYEVDIIPGYSLPIRFDYIVKNVESVTPEVESLDGFTKGQTAKLKIKTENNKIGKNVKILSILSNGEVLVQSRMAGLLSNSSIIYKGEVDRVTTKDLE